MLNEGRRLVIDQDELEPVIPAPGKDVLVVKGIHRGSRGVLDALDQSSLRCTVSLTSGPHAGSIIKDLRLDEICKLQTE